MKILADCDAERGLLSGLIKYGSLSYAEISDLGLTDATFTIDSHNVLFKCLHKIFTDHDGAVIPDVPLIYSASSDLGLKSWYHRDEEVAYLNSIINFPVQENNLRIFALKIKKLEIGRRINERLEQAKNDTVQLNGTESINEIFGILEKSVIDCGQFLSSQDKSASIMGEGLDEYFTELETHPIEQIGISTGFPLYDKAIGGGLRTGSVNVIASRAKVGKEQPYDAIVYTPQGKKLMGELKEGDDVCTPDGQNAKILHIFEQGIKDVYEIEFSDGDKVECGLDHLWSVIHDRYRTEHILSTKELLTLGLFNRNKNPRPKWRIKLPPKVEFNEQKLLITPYIMGVILGDGGITQQIINITNIDEDILNRVKSELINNYFLSKKGDISYTLTRGRTGGKSNYYIEALRKYLLMGKSSHDKFIPQDYLYNSYNNRLSLLQGLMDTDGYIDNKGNIEYATVSKKLAEDFIELVKSLGGICKIKQRQTKCNNKYFYSFRIRISIENGENLFSCNRKKNRFHKRKKNELTRSIKSIKLVSQKQCRCIYINHPAHLYLTNNYIITHNSTLALNIAMHISQLGIPVLYLDSEMSKEDSWTRMIAALSEISIADIETGQYIKVSNEKNKVIKAREKLKNLPIYYQSIAGQPLENQIAFIKRWLITDVGLKKNGQAKPCVIIYDYLKLMNEEEGKGYQEYQAIGFLMTSLVNFTKKYNFPILSFIQTNRDGISKEDASTISQSDRVLWFCSSLSIFKPKEQEEIEAVGYQYGNRKLIVTDCRYGPGLMAGDYINCHFNKNISKIIEGQSHFEVWKQHKQQKPVVKETDDTNEEIDENDTIKF